MAEVNGSINSLPADSMAMKTQIKRSPHFLSSQLKGLNAVETPTLTISKLFVLTRGKTNTGSLT